MHVHRGLIMTSLDRIEYLDGWQTIETPGWYICTYGDIGKPPLSMNGPYETQAQATRLLRESKERTPVEGVSYNEEE